MKRIQRLFAAALLSLAAVTVHAQADLKTYVTRCQTELGFTAAEVLPMNCNDGVQFDTNGGNGPINDFVVHKRVNQNVDQVAACRWGDGTSTLNDNKNFISIELIIHNRVNGGTCFFAAADIGDKPPALPTNPQRPVSAQMVSPTNFATNVYPNASHFWLTPTALNSKLMFSDAHGSTLGFKEQLQCVRCHSQGPYIASLHIVPHLANMGLLNDGHDTTSPFTGTNRYYVVGSNAPTDPNSGNHPFKNWNFLGASHNRTGIRCSNACHQLAREFEPDTGYLPIGSLTSLLQQGARVLPSIASDIQELVGCCMEPWFTDSNWRWINIDQPTPDNVEVETFTASKLKIPVTTYNCGVPGIMDASVVETNSSFSTLGLGLAPNKLRSFNLRDGLVCMNADQPNGARCMDHQISYKCPAGPNTVWTPWYNKDKNITDDGDHEERSKSIAEATAFCGNKTPIAIQMQVVDSGFSTAGPADRLAQFSPTGLVCRDADQGSGQKCSNYVVRYRNCRGDSSTLSKLKNVWTNPPTFGDRYLTTTNNVDGAETRAQAGNYQYPSQDWVIEPVAGGNTIRLADVWSGKYLTASSNSDQAAVQVKDSDTSQMRQQWVMETITGSSDVRFRNVGSGRYLTVGNYTGTDPYFAPIYSQSLNQSWASQRWVVQ